MYHPDAGEIRIDGEPQVIGSPRAAIGLGIGTVYQHLTLVPTLTVLENLMLGIGSQGARLDLAQARSRFDELAGVLGVTLRCRRNALAGWHWVSGSRWRS